MKAGIAIDTWKLAIFTRHLEQSGYEFTQGAGIAPDTLMLYVVTDNAQALQAVLRAANTEAAKTKQG